ncbi:pentapeptide repeat-containing protein [Candidatus Margulisiibacteriota bacterium]
MLGKIVLIKDNIREISTELTEDQRKVIEFLEKHNRDLSDLDLGSMDFHGVDLKGVKFDGAEVRFCNFSGCTNIDWASLNKAKERYTGNGSFVGVDFRGLDLSEFKFSNKDCVAMKLSGCTNIDWQDLNKLTSFERMDLSGLDLKNVKFEKKDCAALILKDCKNVDMRSLTNAKVKEGMLQGLDLRNLDLEGLDFSKLHCKKLKLSGCKNIDWASLNGKEICYSDFSGHDVKDLVFSGQNYLGLNLKGCKNVDIASLNKGKNYASMDLTGLDLKGLNFKGKFLSGTILVGCKNIDWESLSQACLEGVNVREHDLSEFVFDAKGSTVSGMILKGCTNINWESLNRSKHINSMDLSGHDLSKIDFSKRECFFMNLSGCTNIRWDTLNKATSITHINFTGLDLKDFSFKKHSCEGIELTGCKNIKWQEVFSVKGIKDIKVADNYDLFMSIVSFTQLKRSLLIKKYNHMSAEKKLELKNAMAGYKAKYKYYEDFIKKLTTDHFKDAPLDKILNSFSRDMMIQGLNELLAVYSKEQNYQLNSYIFPEDNKYELLFTPQGKTVLKDKDYKLEKDRVNKYFSVVEGIYQDHGRDSRKQEQKNKFEQEIAGFTESRHQGSASYKLAMIMLGACQLAGQGLKFPEEIRNLFIKYHFIYESDIEEFVADSRGVNDAFSEKETEEEKEIRCYDNQLAEIQLLLEETLKNDDTENLLKKMSADEKKEIANSLNKLTQKANSITKQAIERKISGQFRKAFEKIERVLADTADYLTGEKRISLIKKRLATVGIKDAPSKLLTAEEYQDILNKIQEERADLEYKSAKKEEMSIRDLYSMIMQRDISFIRQERNKFMIEKPSRNRARRKLYELLKNLGHKKAIINIFISNEKGKIRYLPELEKTKTDTGLAIDRFKKVKAVLKNNKVKVTDEIEELIIESLKRSDKEGGVGIVAEFSKKYEDFEARKSAGACIEGDVGMWKRKSYLELVLRDKNTQKHCGTIMLEFVKSKKGHTLVFCPNPSNDLLQKVNNSQVFNELFKLIIEFAKANQVKRIVRSSNNGAYTNRVNFPVFMRASERMHKGTYKFSKPVPFSGDKLRYVFQDMIVLWEAEADEDNDEVNKA